MITHYFIYRADHTDRLKFKGVDKLILREVVGDFRAIPNIAQYEIYLRTDIAMPKVYSDPDPVHPAQGEYAALTEYKYTRNHEKKWSQVNFEVDCTAEPIPVQFDGLPLDQGRMT